MSAMMFDLSQIEIVKGSQSSIFGPNSLAGSINLKSSSPTPFGLQVYFQVWMTKINS